MHWYAKLWLIRLYLTAHKTDASFMDVWLFSCKNQKRHENSYKLLVTQWGANG